MLKKKPCIVVDHRTISAHDDRKRKIGRVKDIVRNKSRSWNRSTKKLQSNMFRRHLERSIHSHGHFSTIKKSTALVEEENEEASISLKVHDFFKHGEWNSRNQVPDYSVSSLHLSDDILQLYVSGDLLWLLLLHLSLHLRQHLLHAAQFSFFFLRVTTITG